MTQVGVDSAPGKVIVITGGTGGIGYQAALSLAENKSNTVIITGWDDAFNLEIPTLCLT